MPIDLDDILSRWHQWAAAKRSTRGYASRSLVCGDYRISRQYDDANGALDGDLDDARNRDVDFQVGEMQDPYRSAIHEDARNICAGLVVFRSTRLPADPKQRATIVAEARGMLAIRLTNAGII